jgi:hypothetical protein
MALCGSIRLFPYIIISIYVWNISNFTDFVVFGDSWSEAGRLEYSIAHNGSCLQLDGQTARFELLKFKEQRGSSFITALTGHCCCGWPPSLAIVRGAVYWSDNTQLRRCRAGVC